MKKSIFSEIGRLLKLSDKADLRTLFVVNDGCIEEVRKQEKELKKRGHKVFVVRFSREK